MPGTSSPDYTLLRRQTISEAALPNAGFEIMVTAFDGSDRGRIVLGAAAAAETLCVLLPQYAFSEEEVSALSGEFTAVTMLPVSSDDEADMASMLVSRPNMASARVCVDLSGMPRTHLIHLTQRLLAINPNGLDVVYVEPSHYVHEDETVFAEGEVDVRPVRGFEGVHPPTRDEVLVIGTGFEVDLMNLVARAHPGAQKLQLFGLPSLQPEMYQQNLLQTMLATDAVEGSGVTDRYYAPAYCPYETAAQLSQALRADQRKRNNIYLAPLGTKVQALGFALYYLHECSGPASLLGVASTRLRRKAAIGANRIWHYEVRRLS